MKRIRSASRRLSANVSHTDDNLNTAVGSRAKGLELDLHLREFEISQLTQRNNFFMIFQGVIIAGLVQSQGLAPPIINFSVALVGLATSALQIGMAGGAKYWQSRWEASTRSSEIEVVLALLKQRRLAVRTFTHDLSVLTEGERKQISEWNASQSDPDEHVEDASGEIHKKVLADIGNSPSNPSRRRLLRHKLDWWVRKWAIEPKWSVSRIPIWMGAALFIFWAIVGAHCVSIQGVSFDGPSWISLVPLKSG